MKLYLLDNETDCVLPPSADVSFEFITSAAGVCDCTRAYMAGLQLDGRIPCGVGRFSIVGAAFTTAEEHRLYAWMDPERFTACLEDACIPAEEELLAYLDRVAEAEQACVPESEDPEPVCLTDALAAMKEWYAEPDVRTKVVTLMTEMLLDLNDGELKDQHGVLDADISGTDAHTISKAVLDTLFK